VKVKDEKFVEPEFLSPGDVAAVLGRRIKAVREAIHRGQIPAVKRCGSWFIPRAFVDEMRAEALAGMER
jgi:hypothetical protein